MNCDEIIIRHINTNGPVSFHDFMEMALYHPEAGYYMQKKPVTGKSGDYFTSPFVTAAFGEMVAKQIEEMWILMDKKPFTIVEYGAGTGMLCKDILQYFKYDETLYKNIQYCIIEKSPSMIEQQKKILDEKVSWHTSIKEIAPVNGVILSNELLDNFAVHKVVMCKELKEVFVDYKNGFIEILKPASAEIKNYFRALNVSLPQGFCTEVNLEAIEWLKNISLGLHKGFVITIDYGFTSGELYSEKRSAGTMLCYYQHTINDNPFINIGRQDITAHINFSALEYWGKQYGLNLCGITGQGYFLHSLGIVDHIRKMEQQHPGANNNNPENISMIHSFLTGMGNKLKVMIQKKGIETRRLSGLKFTQEFDFI